MNEEPLIPKHGGYRHLKSFQVAQLVYDLTTRFCDRYVERRSRTHDQMVQAARSGVQNIAEGSQASGTSKKTELKLTNVARASLEELRLDYEDFLRQRGLPVWEREDPRRAQLIVRRCTSADEVARWVKEVSAGCQEAGPQNGASGPGGLGGQHGRSGLEGQHGPGGQSGFDGEGGQSGFAGPGVTGTTLSLSSTGSTLSTKSPRPQSLPRPTTPKSPPTRPWF
ncbi:MAG TPA: four helix bundle protein [Candidatus Sumerlaeota bacterium]|nr:four helix bundle protein [Candidatus Sumerlaeota bacterium]